MAWFWIADSHAGWFGRVGVFPRHRMIDLHDKLNLTWRGGADTHGLSLEVLRLCSFVSGKQ